MIGELKLKYVEVVIALIYAHNVSRLFYTF